MSVSTSTLRIEGGAGRVGWRGWLALAVLMLPVLLVSIDNTVLTFALPEIALALHPSGVEQLWVVDAYSLVLAALLVTMGSLGDRFGRRRMLLIGGTGFAAVSIFAAFAPSAGWLILARALLGVFGAMLMPSTLSLLRTIFTDDKQRRLAVAIWAAGFSAGAALGPIVGGFLLEHFSWGSVFLMAVPVLIPLLVLAPLLVPETRDPNPGPIDGLSILLSIGAMLPIVYAIKEFAVEGLLSIAPILTVVGIVFGWLFVRRQKRLATPMLDMQLFRIPSFTGGIFVNMLSVFALVGFLYFVSQHLQLILGLSPMQAGLALLPGLIVMIISGLVVVPLSQRIPAHILIPGALVFSLVGYIMSAVASQDGALATLVWAFVSLGVGIGMAETISNDTILASAPPEKAGAASAVSETAYELGAVLGTAVLGSILAASYRANLQLPPGVSDETAHAARETLAGAVSEAERIGGDLGQALSDAAAHAFDSGVLLTGIIGAGLVVLAAIVAATTLGRKPTASATAE